jgi:hypothetical protein
MNKLNEVSDTLAGSRQRWAPSNFSVLHKPLLIVHNFPNFGTHFEYHSDLFPERNTTCRDMYRFFVIREE